MLFNNLVNLFAFFNFLLVLNKKLIPLLNMLFAVENYFSGETFDQVIDILPDFIVLSSGPKKSKNKSWIDEFLFLNRRFDLFLIT